MGWPDASLCTEQDAWFGQEAVLRADPAGLQGGQLGDELRIVAVALVTNDQMTAVAPLCRPVRCA